jgi:hypothetical protein
VGGGEGAEDGDLQKGKNFNIALSIIMNTWNYDHLRSRGPGNGIST